MGLHFCFGHCSLKISSIPNFCKVVYVCASCVTSPVLFWHELDFTACHFIHCFLAKCIQCVQSESQMESVSGGEPGEVDIGRGGLCPVHVKLEVS